MANNGLGTKRVDPETGRKFYDLNKDPIVSPYTGKSYPLSFFETVLKPVEEEKKPEVKEVEAEVEVEEEEDDDDAAEIVSLEDADDDDQADDLPADPNVEPFFVRPAGNDESARDERCDILGPASLDR